MRRKKPILRCIRHSDRSSFREILTTRRRRTTRNVDPIHHLRHRRYITLLLHERWRRALRRLQLQPRDRGVVIFADGLVSLGGGGVGGFLGGDDEVVVDRGVEVEDCGRGVGEVVVPGVLCEAAGWEEGVVVCDAVVAVFEHCGGEKAGGCGREGGAAGDVVEAGFGAEGGGCC